MRSSPPPCPVQIFRDTQYLNSLSVSSMFGSGCLRHAEVIGPHYSPPPIFSRITRPGRGRAGGRGGTAREAGLRGAPCVDVNVSVLHSSIVCRRRCCCCYCRCRNRRSSQPRASPLPSRTGEKQPRWGKRSREGCGNRGGRPTGGFHPGRSWPGGSMCLLGELPASR